MYIMYIYTYIYVCMYIYICMYVMYVCMYACMYVYIYIHVHIAKHTQAFSRAKRGGQLPLYDDCGVSDVDSDCLVMFIYFHTLRSSNMAIEHPLYKCRSLARKIIHK